MMCKGGVLRGSLAKGYKGVRGGRSEQGRGKQKGGRAGSMSTSKRVGGRARPYGIGRAVCILSARCRRFFSASCLHEVADGSVVCLTMACTAKLQHRADTVPCSEIEALVFEN